MSEFYGDVNVMNQKHRNQNLLLVKSQYHTKEIDQVGLFSMANGAINFLKVLRCSRFSM